MAVDASVSEGLSGAQLADLRQWLGEALVAERQFIGLELERRHQTLLADCAQRWSAAAQGMALAIEDPGDKASVEQAGSEPLLNSSSGDAEKNINQQDNQASDTSREPPSPCSSTSTPGRRLSKNLSAREKVRTKSVFGAQASIALEDQNWTRRLVTSQEFEIIFAVLILVNTLVMACESQYVGLGVGNKLKYPHFGNTKEDTWPGAHGVFVALDYFFGVVFTLEVIIKMVGLRRSFLKDRWNVFDLVIVLTWMFDALTRDLVELPVDPMLLRLARLARLLRLMKLLKTMQGVDQLFLMLTALKGSAIVLFWTVVILLTAQTMFAFLCNQIIVAYYLDIDGKDTKEQREVFKYFGTFTRSMLSMFEITFGNWVPVARTLYENVSAWFMVFSLCHKLSMGFAVLGVINGIFIQETFKVAACDDTIMLLQKERQIRVHGKKMQAFFAEADQSGDGTLSRDEFRDILQNPQIKTWLAAQELDASDADKLFTLIDNGDNTVSAMELVKGVSKLKGAAKGLDMAFVSRQHLETQQQIQKILDTLSVKSVNTQIVNVPDLSGQNYQDIEPSKGEDRLWQEMSSAFRQLAFTVRQIASMRGDELLLQEMAGPIFDDLLQDGLSGIVPGATRPHGRPGRAVKI